MLHDMFIGNNAPLTNHKTGANQTRVISKIQFENSPNWLSYFNEFLLFANIAAAAFL